MLNVLTEKKAKNIEINLLAALRQKMAARLSA
jgi:hypothetical protein